MVQLFEQPLSEIQRHLRAGDLSVSELVEYAFQRIAATDTSVHAFLTLDEERARAKALQLDQDLIALRGKDAQNFAGDAPLSPLFGLPAGVKDNISTQALRTTCASQFLHDFVPVYDAAVMQKLAQAQVITIGKLNMDEFAMGGSNENSAFGAVHNPWNLDYVPGGSSGGSAAAVAAGQVYFALGSDTGGSIRQPASYCGVVGLKPTYGLVSRYGLVAFASSLDQIGPLTKNVEDAAYVLQAIAGYDPYDSTSANVEIPDYRAALMDTDLRGIRIGVPREYMGEGVAPSVRAAIGEALKQFEQLGAAWEEVSLPHTEYAVATYYLLASSEASSNLARFDGIRYGTRAPHPANLLELYRQSRSQGFGTEVKRRIMLGTFALSSGYYDAYYNKAQRVRTLIKQDFDHVFERYDLLIGPTAPTPAFKLGTQADDPLTMYLNDILTIPVSLAGLPAISIPCGFSSDHLPIGLQIIGKPFAETQVLHAAYAFEQHTTFHKQRPQMGGIMNHA